jgi:hypothetical protein
MLRCFDHETGTGKTNSYRDLVRKSHRKLQNGDGRILLRLTAKCPECSNLFILAQDILK